jgi:RNA recognition motif-containing protein
VTDRETGRSRGFGFVQMADDSGASAAIEMWNGKEFDGRTLTVSEARPKA